MERNNSPNYFFILAIVAAVAVVGIVIMIMGVNAPTADVAGEVVRANAALGKKLVNTEPVPEPSIFNPGQQSNSNPGEGTTNIAGSGVSCNDNLISYGSSSKAFTCVNPTFDKIVTFLYHGGVPGQMIYAMATTSPPNSFQESYIYYTNGDYWLAHHNTLSFAGNLADLSEAYQLDMLQVYNTKTTGSLSDIAGLTLGLLSVGGTDVFLENNGAEPNINAPSAALAYTVSVDAQYFLDTSVTDLSPNIIPNRHMTLYFCDNLEALGYCWEDTQNWINDDCVFNKCRRLTGQNYWMACVKEASSELEHCQQAVPPPPQFGCGSTITEPGDYYLGSDWNCDGDGIIVNLAQSGTVNIYGDGFSITGLEVYNSEFKGIKVENGNVNINDIEITKFKNGVYVGSGAIVNINSGIFNENADNGVLVYGTATIISGTFSNNGEFGIDVTGGSATVWNGEFQYNGDSGAHAAGNGLLTINGGVFSNSLRGAYVTDGGTMNIGGGYLTNNNVGVALVSGTLNINQGSFSNNGEFGVFVSGGTANINDGTFYNSPYAAYVSGSAAVAIISGGTFQNSGLFGLYVTDYGTAKIYNTAKFQFNPNGAYVRNNGVLQIYYGTFFENTGSGVISITNGIVEIYDGVFTQNSIGVNVGGGGFAEISGGTFSGNTNSDLFTSSSSTYLNGGRFCSGNPSTANIAASSGITISGSGAKCNSANPSGVYPCGGTNSCTSGALSSKVSSQNQGAY